MREDIPAKDLFMMCAALNHNALSGMPEGYTIRRCRPDELETWKALHIDEPAQYEAYNEVLTRYFSDVYLNKGDLFFKKCMFACNAEGLPVGTCFIWKAYDRVSTVHWFKVCKTYEGRGIGRALLSHVMGALAREDYPVFLHTHPSSYRAIKLYSDVGFHFITDKRVGSRDNDLEECLPILKKYMPQRYCEGLKTVNAPPYFLDAVNSSPIDEF